MTTYTQHSLAQGKSHLGHRGATQHSPIVLPGLPFCLPGNAFFPQSLRGVIMRADSVSELIGTVGVSRKGRLKIVH